MDERAMLTVLTFIQALHITSAVFFHEPSSSVIEPFVQEDNSDFGFAMAYQSSSNSLVVGAPRVDFLGKMYSCEMDNAGTFDTISCDENLIDFDSLAEYTREKFPDQYFYTGSSIVATSDFLFTCAPLWTTNLTVASGDVKSDAFGTCFVHNRNGTHRYKGTFERYSHGRSGITNLKSFFGGIGWSTLVDEENDLLLIVKTSLEGDIIFAPVSDPLKETHSLVLESRISANYLPQHYNTGYGITAGKFFSNRTIYAFSMENQNMEGFISFLEYDKRKQKMSLVLRNKKPFALKNQDIGTMFGSTLGAADLDMDGLDELLVGAPAQSEDECVECGALHIYISGEMETIGSDRNRLRKILGTSDFGRFGTAIAANDIDGDDIPELLVSAPYEDEGHGAVYILSGFELHRSLIKAKTFKSVQVSDLKLTQRIQKESYRRLGYSLQFVGDTDDNGCKELAVGTPGNGTVLLFKCVQAINLTLSSQLIGEQIVREQDGNFTVKVCVRVQLPELPKDIVGNVSVVSSIIGEATNIPESKFVIDISCYDCKKDRILCKNVNVVLLLPATSYADPVAYASDNGVTTIENLKRMMSDSKSLGTGKQRDARDDSGSSRTFIFNDKEPHDYIFTSKAELHNDLIENNRVFNETWVVASPYSELMRSIEVPRHCKGDDCIPKLSMKVFWSGREKYYNLGSSPNETATIRVRNDGNASYDGCVWLRVKGAPVTRLDCEANYGGYKCHLPSPLKRDFEYSINLVVNMTKPTDMEERLQVEAKLYENCNQKSIASDLLQIPYKYPTTGIFTKGISHNRSVTDKQMLISETIYDDHEYLITNNGNITWKNVYAIIQMKYKEYIGSFNMSETDSNKCMAVKIPDHIAYKCFLDLMPNTTQKITATTQIIGSYLKNDEKFNTSSQLTLHLVQAADIKTSNVTNVLAFQKESSFGSNKLLISLLALLLAIIILAIVIFVLYKRGFFRRKQKQRLHVLRESLKRKNSRRTTFVSEAKDGPAEGLQMEVDDGDPFDEVPIPVTTKDNAVLVHDKE